MPTLRKSIRDAIAADHAAGFTHVEIAERNGIHRNTVRKHLPAGSATAIAPTGTASAVDLALLARHVVVRPCSECGTAVPILRTQPNLQWQSELIGYYLRCSCGAGLAFAMAGREAELDAWRRSAGTRVR